MSLHKRLERLEALFFPDEHQTTMTWDEFSFVYNLFQKYGSAHVEEHISGIKLYKYRRLIARMYRSGRIAPAAAERQDSAATATSALNDKPKAKVSETLRENPALKNLAEVTTPKPDVVAKPVSKKLEEQRKQERCKRMMEEIDRRAKESDLAIARSGGILR